MSWDTFKIVDVQVNLKQGRNTIKLYNDNSYQFSSLVNSTAPEIDSVSISRQSYDSTSVKKIAKTTTNKHNYEVKTTPSTCTKAGSKIYTCTDCEYTYKETLKAVGHKSNSGVVTAKATCDKAGKKTYSCTVCKTVLKTETIKPTGHKSNSGVVTAKATCGKAGKKTYSCTVCKAVIKTESIKATGKHTYNSGKVTKAPTSSATGTMTYSCKTCGVKKTSKIAKLVKTSISKIIPKSKGFSVAWKKVSSASGYQIQYSTSSKFKSSKTVTITKNGTVSKSVTKLKANKKYYVRVRIHKIINGKKYYSSWSKSATVKTKK